MCRTMRLLAVTSTTRLRRRRLSFRRRLPHDDRGPRSLGCLHDACAGWYVVRWSGDCEPCYLVCVVNVCAEGRLTAAPTPGTFIATYSHTRQNNWMLKGEQSCIHDRAPRSSPKLCSGMAPTMGTYLKIAKWQVWFGSCDVVVLSAFQLQLLSLSHRVERAGPALPQHHHSVEPAPAGSLTEPNRSRLVKKMITDPNRNRLGV